MDVYTVYIVAGAAGATAGIARFLQSKQVWKIRTFCASSLVGAILAVAVPAWWFGNDVVENPWKAIAVALAVGLFQPEGAKIIESILKVASGEKGGEK